MAKMMTNFNQKTMSTNSVSTKSTSTTSFSTKSVSSNRGTYFRYDNNHNLTETQPSVSLAAVIRLNSRHYRLKYKYLNKFNESIFLEKIRSLDDTSSEICIPIELQKQIPRVRSKWEKNPAKETTKNYTIRRLVNCYHTLGFLKECPHDTEYCSPVKLLDNQMIVDYKRLNDATLDLPVVLDDPAECIDQITQSNYFSLFVFTDGIGQFRIKDDCMAFTSFEVNGFIYCWKTMQESLKNAEKHMQRILKSIFIDGLDDFKYENLANDIKKSITIVKNQIILHTLSEALHYEAYIYIIQKCKINDLKINPEKSMFYKGYIDCLGQRINSFGVKINLEERENLVKMTDQPESFDQCKSLVQHLSLFKNHLIQDSEKQLLQSLWGLSRRFKSLNSFAELHKLKSTIKKLKTILLKSGTNRLKPGKTEFSTQLLSGNSLIPRAFSNFIAINFFELKSSSISLSQLTRFQPVYLQSNNKQPNQIRLGNFTRLPPGYHQNEGSVELVVGQKIKKKTAEDILLEYYESKPNPLEAKRKMDSRSRFIFNRKLSNYVQNFSKIEEENVLETVDSDTEITSKKSRMERQ